MDKFDIRGEYSSIYSRFPASTPSPVIGITANYRDNNAMVAEAYYLSVLEAGGTPLIIPPYANRNALMETLRHVDALLLTGGADIDPRYMGQEPDYTLLHSINPKRDEQELLLVRLAVDMNIPILGICRGMQVLAAALGGDVHQDIYAALGDGLLNHDQEPAERHVATHDVRISNDTLLHRIFSCGTIAVNTFHHQSVSSVPVRFDVVATSPDGVIEAMEAVDGRVILAVQWHPESFILNGDRCMMPLFDWIVGEACLYRRSREIHSRIVSVDSHCDTPMLFAQGYEMYERSGTALVDMHKMCQGALDAVTMVAYLKQGARDEASLLKATEDADMLLQGISNRVMRCDGHVALCASPAEVVAAKRAGKRVVMRGIENGYAIGKDLSNIQRYRDMGVVYITLCHNGDNDICDSARGKNEHGGLSDFGKEVVREMNRTGMLIDLSHAAESSFWQVLEYSSQPVVCSHSSCKALCNHPRNLTDEQLEAIASKGGVVQVTMYSGFLRQEGEATLDDFIAHLEHAVKVAGIDHVGIGTDFDGDGAVIGCSDASQLLNVTRELLRRGYGEVELEKIWGANWLRVMHHVQHV
ncbi:MAG: gamma-glutamyl-gamma-aminobutyrate hydrolase family protein [Bacteroidaceae bacterium]|nr:gamma-glutamyl-gamma-aminobutyrate hydrolase family protein [Bacteroidaceae bacterium]